MTEDSPTGITLPHSANAKYIFGYAAEEVEPDNAYEFIEDSISRTGNLFRLSSINDEGSKDFAITLNLLAEKCPKEDKLKMFETLDSRGILDGSFEHEQYYYIASFLQNIFKGTDTDELINVLHDSFSWKKVPRTQTIVDWFESVGADDFMKLIKLGMSNDMNNNSYDL